MVVEKDDEFVQIPRDEYVINILATGIAIQTLSQKTGIPIESWSQILSEKATEQYEHLSAKQIQRVIDTYEAIRKA
ncbi:MAG: hypothetical protein V7K47_20630 [Nostoc sp.]